MRIAKSMLMDHSVLNSNFVHISRETLLTRNIKNAAGFQGVGTVGVISKPSADARRLSAAMLRCFCCSS